jgi:hypothetical protein
MDTLRPLLGLWRTSGYVLDRSGRPEVTITGTDEYELLDGAQWVIHRVDVVMGDVRIVALEFIGDVDENGTFTTRAFDASGRYDEMRLAVTGERVLSLAGDGVRSTLRVGDATMEAFWEREADAGWVPWMQLRFDRIR